MNISFLIYSAIEWIISILPILIPLVAVILIFVQPRYLILLFLFLLGFQGIFMDIGFTVTVPRILLFFALITLLIYESDNLEFAINSYPAKTMLLILIFFFSASSLLNAHFFPVKNIITAYGPLGDSWFRDRITREISQIMAFVMKAAVPIVILAFGRTRELVKKAALFVIAGTTALCLYGLYQVAAYAYHLPAIFLFNGAIRPKGNIAIFSTPWGRVLRISSLAGEPKELAGLLLPVIIFIGILLWYMPKNAENALKIGILRLLLLLHFVVFILTFSTAGWLAGLISLVGIILLFWRRLPKLKSIAVVSGLLVICAGIYVCVPVVNEIIRSRFVNRINLDFAENPDYGTPQLLHMYKTWPHTVYLGASLGGGVFFEQYNEQPESPIYFLFDYGLIGILLYGLFLFRFYRINRLLMLKNNLIDDPLVNAAFYGMAGAMISVFIFPKVDATFMLWAMMGLTAAAVLKAKNKGTDAEATNVNNLSILLGPHL